MRLRWLVACATAEAVGMAAAAGAARGADGLEPGAGLALVVAGGLVEGSALGFLQSRALDGLLDRSRRLPWALVTVLVAGLGWAAASAPSALDGGTDPTPPSWALVLPGAAALGLVMGAVLGAAQAATLRGVVPHPWRWVWASAAGWTVAMPLVFAGATTAGASWAWPPVVGYGALTGALAGAALGLVSGPWLGALEGPPLRDRLVLALLVHRRRPAQEGVTALAVRGARTGHVHRFPVMCAPLGHTSLVVVPGHAEHKTWWRQLEASPDVALLDRGSWRPARARVIERGTLEWSVARSAYVARRRRVRITDGPLVVVDLRPARAVGGDQGPAGAGPGAVGAGAAAS